MPSKQQLEDELSQLSIADERRFRRRLAKARSPKALSAIAADMMTARESVDKRARSIPAITYPEQLPVSARKDDIADAIRDHQVVIIAGETGSGKTTQIPKICLDIGRGRRGLIGHTQPRRLAARTVAERIADELGQRIGESIGYAIRFDDQVSPQTAVKLMTDGILLAEMQHDRYLNAYDTIIIDEAHERSLNIDFLLGYLKQLLPKRPDLKVIITSATIDPERFAAHFADQDGNPAPIIEVSGRTYPVEVLYRPLQVESGGKLIDIDPLDGLLSAIEELMEYGDGDILCFFPGEADIRDAMEAIAGKRWRNVDVVPLFGRLSNQEQHRVFSPHAHRRIVLSTNIAETSLTVPGIHFVVDTGTARISRYSTKTKVQRLPIEDISQASANQRSGRCGRVADGIAIRLYSEEDYLSRPEFTDPEILRTNLASVILQMAALKLGNIEDFPFVQAPDTRAIRDGIILLKELGALEDSDNNTNLPKLTPIGRDIARLPVDPRMARMIIEARRLGCLREVQVIVAALSIQDVRERPLEYQAQADQLHARFKNKTSDFLGYLKLWDYIARSREELSGNAFRNRMRKEFLHYLRIREWFDLVRQLKSVCGQLGWTTDDAALDRYVPEAKQLHSSQPGNRGNHQGQGAHAHSHTNQADTDEVIGAEQADAVHQSLLSGLLSHIGIRNVDTREYQGARNTKFMIFPGSALAKTNPQYVMAAELVETSRLWARDVASIDPRWVERLAANLLKSTYSEPHWSSKRAAAMAYQRSTLYGVPVVADRLVPYHTIDPVAARDMFIREALIAGDWRTHHKFFHRNAEKLQAATELEERARRRDIVVDEDTLFDFYDSRLPEHITTGTRFDQWWKKTQRTQPNLLDFDPAALVHHAADSVTETDFPTTWVYTAGGETLHFDLTYRFVPGEPDDGVTVHVPVPLLAGLQPTGSEWLVPGMREDLVTELIRSLPKQVRRHVVPAPDYARRVVPLLDSRRTEPLRAQLAAALTEVSGHVISPEEFRFDSLPAHLRMLFAAVDRRGKIIDSDKDLSSLKRRRATQIQSSVSQAGHRVEQDSVSEWTADTLGTIPSEIFTKVDGQRVAAYPALVATPEGVAVKVFGTRAEADASMMTATLTLLLRKIPVPAQKMVNGLPLRQRVGVENYPHGGVSGLVADARVAATRDLLVRHGGPVRDPGEFAELLAKIRPEVPGLVRQMIVELAPALVEFVALRQELANWTGEAITDMQAQLEFLVPKNALAVHGIGRLKHLGRYVKAIRMRLDDMGVQPDRDARRQAVIHGLEATLAARLAKMPAARTKSAAVKDIYWLLQELRVSLFAQTLGTAQKVSESKISKAIAALR